jgi:hypothetical protein
MVGAWHRGAAGCRAWTKDSWALFGKYETHEKKNQINVTLILLPAYTPVE